MNGIQKGFHIVIFILVFGFFSVTNINAAERYETIELAESGHVITFPMSPDEIAAEDAAIAKRAQDRELTKPAKEVLVERVELAESGRVIEFNLNPDEIRQAEIAQAEKTRNSLAVKPTQLYSQCRTYEVFEMSDGHTIEFEVEAGTVEGYTSLTAERLFSSTC